VEDRIRELAYLKWEAAGYPSGDGVEFWLQAEEELRSLRPTLKEKSDRKVAPKSKRK